VLPILHETIQALFYLRFKEFWRSFLLELLIWNFYYIRYDLKVLLWLRYISTNITFLDIIHCLVFMWKRRPVYPSKENVSETGFWLGLQVKPTQSSPIDRSSLDPEIHNALSCQRVERESRNLPLLLPELDISDEILSSPTRVYAERTVGLLTSGFYWRVGHCTSVPLPVNIPILHSLFLDPILYEIY
jgi:hypothetical protein